MIDSVLIANNRGHFSQDVVNASLLIKEHGFSLGLQMMTGLYMSSDEFDILTAKKIAELNPDTVRIYPTITLKNTYLEQLYTEGKYIPMSLDDSVSLAVIIEDIFIAKNINVIRLGLHSIDTDAYISGPWHPAFRELSESYRFRNKLETKTKSGFSYNVYVCPRDVSKFIGQNHSNIIYFKDKNIELKIIPDKSIKESDFIVEEVN